MKLIRNILATLVLLSPAMVKAQEITPTPELSRDSIVAVVEAAEASDPEALNILGSWYYTGTGLEKDYSVAARLWAKAAQLGNIAATGNLGMCYQMGHGVEADSVRAMGLYTKSLRMGNHDLFESLRSAADRGQSFECFAVAHFYNEGIGCTRDYATAGKYYALMARKGNVIAMRDAGVAFLNAKDYNNAINWFAKGAAAANITCNYYYGRMLVEGLGCTADPSKGFVEALKAADAGLANAQYFVSQLYADGRGVSASASESARWLRVAAFQGLSRAMLDYGELAAREDNYLDASYMFSWLARRKSYVAQMTALFSPEAENSLAETLFGHYTLALKAIAAGDVKSARDEIKFLKKNKSSITDILEAQLLLSPANEKRDVKKAVKMLTKLADKENALAAYILASLYERGIADSDFTADPAKAKELYLQAIEAGYEPANIAMGNFFYEGLGGSKDTRAAVDFYHTAYEAGYMLSDAASRYSSCLETGSGVARNENVAKKLADQKYPVSFTDYLEILK